MRRALPVLLMWAFALPAAWGDEAKRTAEYTVGDLGVRGIMLAESDSTVYGITLKAGVDAKGEGGGVLTLSRTGPPQVDDFGFAVQSKPVAPLILDCKLQFVKSIIKEYSSRRLGAPPSERTIHKEEWRLYSITGPRISSRLFLSATARPNAPARLLIQSSDGKVQHSITVTPPSPPLYEPCHPGCFPAGTPVVVPNGMVLINMLRVGDYVTTVGQKGELGQGRIESISVVRNRLIEVQTEAGVLAVTTTQPLALANGRLRSAGELSVGEQILSWNGQESKPVRVKAIKIVDRTEQVFNLVLSDEALMIAGGYLAKSKPPNQVVAP